MERELIRLEKVEGEKDGEAIYDLYFKKRKLAEHITLAEFAVALDRLREEETKA